MSFLHVFALFNVVPVLKFRGWPQALYAAET
jgi:hypothetical protein